MKQSWIIVFALLLACGSESNLNQEIINHEGEQVLVGLIDRRGIEQPPYNTWFSSNYNDYLVDEGSLNTMQDRIGDIEILLFLGTWCSDSQQQVPQFYKMMDYLEYDYDDLIMVGLDNHPEHDLQSPQHEEVGFDITNVPTWIFFEGKKEIGRIVEYPETTIEKDMVRIISGS